ncbi:Vcpkmt [Symbiodinium sp. CCMP2592]|nr:Vcpkmt [Symbiodinium sp. CCMP2592]
MPSVPHSDGASPGASASVDCVSLQDVHTTGVWRRSLCDYSRRFKAKVKLQHEGETVIVSQAPHVQAWESSDPMSTGSTVWDSALVLLHFLAQRSELVAGREVLELGAGTGLVGLAAERIFKARRILLTDLPGLCPLLRVNLDLNSFTAGEVRPLLWQEAHCSWLSEGHSFSRVLMSDVLYHEPQYAPLLNVLRVLARSHRGEKPLIVYWAQEAHNPELCRRLVKSLAKEGWGQKLVTRVDDGLGAEIFVCTLTAPTASKRSAVLAQDQEVRGSEAAWRGWQEIGKERQGAGTGQADGATARILELLKGAGTPDTKETVLEYRGQWQPKPNGAETGHGVVPEDWAIEVASENDRRLASFGWAGGAQLCLSNAFRQADELEAQAKDLIESGTCTEDDAAVQCIRTLAKATEEREALMRRQWCDIDFQQGEEANKELLKHLEKDFASQLVKTAVRQAEDEDQSEAPPWYNLKLCTGALRGKVYLSAGSGGDGLAELAGHDDESGRQRWQLESGGTAEAAVSSSRSWYRLRLSGGTTPGRRLLSRGARCLELCEHDDGSGRQRWQVLRGSSGWVLRAAVGCGDPGVGAAALVEAEAAGCCLGATPAGAVSLQAVEAEWEIVGPGGSFQDPLAETSPRPKEPEAEARERDELMEIVERSTSSMDWKAMSEDRMRRVLGQSRNLGTAIDLVGAYLKNYEIDKADRLCARIFPLCLERGGIWHFKLLNFYTTVRMKQSRYQEALEMYKEYETLIKFSPDEAWELYDTVYRNFGWIYTSLHDYDKALEYFERCVDVKKKHGVKAHWFDQWDLGKTHARLSLQQGRPERLEMAGQLIEEALAMHREVEPSDLIMRCKMLNSAGECFSVRGDFCSEQKVAERSWDRAIALHEESYELYMKVLGPSKPLTGWAMEDLAGAYKRRGRLEEAKRLILGALRVECSKDIIKLSSMARLLDAVLELHKETRDLAGLADCQDAINEGLENLQKRRIDRSEAASYAALLQKIAQLLLEYDVANREGAVALLQEALGYLNHLKAPAPAKTASMDSSQKPHPESAAPDGQADAQGERLHIPKAGQQEMQVDPEVLKTSIEEQLQSLRTWHCRSRGTSRPDSEQDIHFEVAGSSRM